MSYHVICPALDDPLIRHPSSQDQKFQDERETLSKRKEITNAKDLGWGSDVVAKNWLWILSLHEYRTVLLLELTKSRRNIHAQNQE